MASQSKKITFPSFGHNGWGQSPHPPAPVDAAIQQQLKIRNNFYFGAVLNAFDDYLRKGPAYGLPQHAIATEILPHDDIFYFCVKALPEDAFEEAPCNIVAAFFHELHEIAADYELESVTSGKVFDEKTGQTSFMMVVKSKYELLQMAEQLLKPYDMVESFMPTFHRARDNAGSSVPFSLFPQYSLRHIRAMYYMSQGRSEKVSGMDLNH